MRRSCSRAIRAACFYDHEPVQAEATRRKVYDMLSAEKMTVQGFIIRFPSVAHVEKTATGYQESRCCGIRCCNRAASDYRRVRVAKALFAPRPAVARETKPRGHGARAPLPTNDSILAGRNVL